MALKVPDDAELLFAQMIKDNWTTVIRLFKNDKVPANGDDVSDYTEADFSGYAEQDITSGWANPITLNDKATLIGSTAVFTHNGGPTGNSIYGYYIVDGNGDLLFAERNPAAPTTIDQLGETYAVAPLFTFSSES